MRPAPALVYSAGEIARAAGVAEHDVRALLGAGHRNRYVSHEDAVRLGRVLVERARAASSAPDPLFTVISGPTSSRRRLVPLALSSSLHAGLAIVFVVVAGWSIAPRAAALRLDDRPADLLRMVFLQTPGPGGGGGGGGLKQPTPPPKAMREGTRRLSSPLPKRQPPKPIEPTPKPPEPPPPLKAEQLPVVVAPIVTAPADPRTRIGVMEQTSAQTDAHGPGQGGGAGTGAGTGLGAGDGAGIGPGSGGGTGGGPYRPGSGITPPRLLREVKAEYTEEARQRSISGDVLLEIVVRRDGSVGDVRVLQGLGGGLNDRAVRAVRQWRFAPAERLGAAVDVIVEVAVEFTLR
jgi:protein TonB